MKKNLFKQIISFIIVLFICIPYISIASSYSVLAQGANSAGGGGGSTSAGGTGGSTSAGGAGGSTQSSRIVISNPFKADSIESLIRFIINDILMPIGGVLAVLAIMYSGFLYITANGNSSKIEAATKGIKYSVLGAALLLGAWVLSEAIAGTIDELRR